VIQEPENPAPESSPTPIFEDVDAPQTYAAPFSSFNFDNPTPLSKIKDLKIEEEDFIPTLQVACYLYDKDHLNVVIRDADRDRYELPHKYPFPYPKNPTATTLEESNFVVKVEKDPFDIVIKRKSTGETIFKLTDRLVFTNLYIEFSFVIPTNEIYGLGERIGPLQYHEGTYSLFIVDRLGQIDKGVKGFNVQGHHSMYMNKEKSGLYSVNLLKNIAAQEVVIQPNNKITWKVIGGVLDFNFFLGTSPENVLQKYHGYIGGWALPAFWHLGSHQCKWWGYKNNGELDYVMRSYNKAGIPLDSMWTDLEIFKDDINLEFDTTRYPVKEFNEMYDKYQKRWISVIQAYVPTQKENMVWKYPNAMDYVIRDGMYQNATGGYQYSGPVYFYDFLNPETEGFWAHSMGSLNNQRPLDGIWLDANEITDYAMRWNDETIKEYYKDINKRKYYKLPFYPGGENLYDLHIVKVDSVHYDGTDEYNVRSLNPFYQSLFTYNYMIKQNKVYFPFVLSRGNQFGSGQFSFHFIPDLRTNYNSLRASVAPIMNYNIYGIPMVGADICGMGSSFRSPPELCARWYQAAVFYTFARNQHSPTMEEYNSQEPYTYDGPEGKDIKDHIHLRYSLLKQMYTYFFAQPRQSSDKKLRVGTVTRPLFFEFNDKTMPAFGAKYYEEQFMVYDAVMVAPVLDEGAKKLNVFFPNTRWFDLRDNTEVQGRGEVLKISAKLTEGLPYFLRGGKLLMKQNTEGVLRTEDLDNKFTIVGGLADPVDVNGDIIACSHGNILDVADYSEESIYKKCVMEDCLMSVSVHLTITSTEAIVTLRTAGPVKAAPTTPVVIKDIMLLGVYKENRIKPHGHITVDGEEFAESKYSYDATKGLLSIFIKDHDGLVLPANSVHEIHLETLPTPTH